MFDISFIDALLFYLFIWGDSLLGVCYCEVFDLIILNLIFLECDLFFTYEWSYLLVKETYKPFDLLFYLVKCFLFTDPLMI